MKHRRTVCLIAIVLAISACSIRAASAQYAVGVVSYDSGSTPAIEFGSSLPFDLESSALGEPTRFTGEPPFAGVVTPFNPPFQRSELISVGEGGHLVLRLSNYALPQAGAPEIGVFGHAGIADVDFPNGRAGSPPFAFGVDSALVDVSADGINWVSLGNVTFDLPTNGYTDLTVAASSVPGSVPSDFQQPFTGSLNDFGGLPYFDAAGPDMLELLGVSGGGTWLDISGTGFARVGYVRFSVADDANSTTRLNFELDAVSISHAARGTGTVPEPLTISLMSSALGLALIVNRQRHRSTAGCRPN